MPKCARAYPEKPPLVLPAVRSASCDGRAMCLPSVPAAPAAQLGKEGCRVGWVKARARNATAGSTPLACERSNSLRFAALCAASHFIPKEYAALLYRRTRAAQKLNVSGMQGLASFGRVNPWHGTVRSVSFIH